VTDIAPSPATVRPALRARLRRPGRRGVASALGVGVALAALAGCSATPSPQPTGSPTTSAARTEADCSSKALLAALPRGATMKRFDCATEGREHWAAAEVEPGNTVFFLRWHQTSWLAEDSESVCGTASAGVPSSLLTYCSTPQPSPTRSRSGSPSPRPDPAEACTSQKILAALPGGATMQQFSCAEVGGTQWAAARVDPGPTVFFLQWDGRRWNAQDSKSVCGTASAGLPETLLQYCRT
jgi:hypothetical protein